MRAAVGARTRTTLAGAVLAGAAYYALALLSQSFAQPPSGGAVLWLPSGLLFGVLLRTTPRQWPVYLAAAGLGSLAADLGAGFSLRDAVEFIAVNLASGAAGALVVRRVAGPTVRLASLREVVVLATAALLVVSPLSATLGASIIHLGSGPAPFWATWMVLWPATGLGALVIGAVILASASPREWCRKVGPARAAEVAGILAAAGVAAALTYGGTPHGGGVGWLWQWAPAPLFLWAALRFGPGSVAAGALLLAVVATWSTLHDRGVLTALASNPLQRVEYLQGYLAVTVLSALALAGVTVDLRRTVQALRDGEERLRYLASFTYEGIGLSEHGKLIEANEQLARMLGYTAEELAGRPVEEFVAPESRDVVRRHIESGSEEPYEHLLRRRDGTAVPVEGRGRRLVYRGRPVRVTVLRDLSERKRGEAALLAAEAKYHGIFENAVEGIFRTGVDGRILEANPAMARAHGYASVGDMMAAVRNIGDVYAQPAQRHEFRERLRRDGVVTGFEIEALRKDGSHVWLSIAARAMHDSAGRVQYYEGTTEDITSRKVSEDRVRQAQKMEALGTLAGGIAHDFNNILHALVANVELLRMELDEDSVAQEMVGEIRAATRRATDLVRQILAFSRQQDQQRQPVQLSPVVKEVGKLLRAALPSSIAITTDIGADLPHVLADASQIHQVLMNLATNAGHAMHAAGGTLTLALRREWVTPERAALLQGLRDGPYVRLTVADTGEGMDAATIGRIFEPFFTTKGPGEGTGLGLSVVHGIVTSHDGAITVASRRGAGTTFDIYLPAIETAATRPPGQPDTLPRGHGERVAVVDDEPAVLRSAVRVLLQLGYTATGFARPQDALDTLVGNLDACDAVITDLTMPGMTGLDVTRRLREAGLVVPIILTTGYSASLTEEAARAQGVSAVLAKPFNAEGVAHLLQRVLTHVPR